MPFLKNFLLFSVPLYIVDQITKWLIVWNYQPPIPEAGFYDVKAEEGGWFAKFEQMVEIEGVFDIVRVHNTGVAFGRFNGTAWANVVFTGVAVAALVVIAILWRKKAFPVKTSQWAIFFLIPGILGNLTDRLIHGYVVDFLSVDLQFMVWPSFNVADSCICIAAGLLAISAFQKEPEKENEVEPNPGATQSDGRSK